MKKKKKRHKEGNTCMHTTIYTYLHTSARAFRLAPDLWLRDNMQRGDKDNL